MREIFLIRHGETEWNAAGRFQGKLDSALTSSGILQAKMVGLRLSDVASHATAMAVSPLGRTRQTASLISNYGRFPSPQYDDRLAEVSIGSWDGLTDIEIEAEFPGALDGATPFDWYFRSPDGETYDAAMERANRWLMSIEVPSIAVSHGLMGRIIRAAYLNLSKEDALCLPVPQDVVWHLANGGVTAIPANGPATVSSE